MEYLRATLLLLLGGTWLANQAPPQSVQSGDLPAQLHATVRSYRLQKINFVEALVQVSSDFHVPMGIEWIPTPSSRAEVNLSWKDTTVAGVLAALVGAQPGYGMRVMADVVRIAPDRFLPDSQNPLKVALGPFSVKNVSAERASRELHSRVKFKLAAPSGAGKVSGGTGGSGASNLGDPRISVQLENTTLEEALDALVLASARKIWIVTFSEDPGLTQRGFRRTLTLWNDFPIPDREQPLWDLLHWGDHIPRTTETLGRVPD